MIKKNTILVDIPKRQLDFILHYPVLQKLRQEQFCAGKAYYGKANAYIIIQYYKSFRVVNRMKGAALVLYKTQFIKKPKSPI